MNAIFRRLDALETNLLPNDERSLDVLRKRQLRSAAAEVFIPPVVNPERRAACLADPVLFLRTYNPTGDKGFTTPFAQHHLRMIEAIYERAISGGDKAVAAPRGDGKTSVATWMAIYIILAGYTRSLIIVGSTKKHAKKIFRDIKNAFARNQLLAEDFPEICACVRELDGAPQRAGKQHVQNQLTHIVWTQDDIEFPSVPGSPYGGARIAYTGLDGQIRGGRFEFALIDDPETKEVAVNEESNQKVEELIDGDIAGLAYPNSSISRVVLTTIQNRRCYSFRVTDPKRKPTFAGERYGMLASWPTNRELWDEYIAKRQVAQAAGDKDGLDALQFFLDNREAMEAGAVVTNPNRFNQRVNEQGQAVEICALQAFFNRVADWGLARVLAELQNDPEEEETEQTLSLTAGKVQSRVSGLRQNELPRQDVIKIVLGMDIGNHASHWVKLALFGNATGCVIDYGVMETSNMMHNATQDVVTAKLLPALYDWRTNIMAENPPDFALLDSGSGMHQEAVYEFIRQVVGSPFAASKGWDHGRFRIGKDGDDRRTFLECYASLQASERIWLYNVNTEFWKNWVQERFATPTFDSAMQFNDGAFSLFSSPNNPKEHLRFAQHIVAEERQELFVEGKGVQRRWIVKNKNNHWLDAMALAAAAAGCLGVRLVRKVSIEEMDKAAQQQAQKIMKNTRQGVVNRFTTPDGRPFLATERN